MSTERCRRASGSSGAGHRRRRLPRAARASARTQVEAISGRRPEIAGVLRRSEGDFDEILADARDRRRADRRHRPGARLRAAGAARRQARGHRQQAADRPARRRAVRRRARGRASSCASRRRWPGVVPVIRVIQESLAATEITKVFGIVNGTTNFILTEMAQHRRLLRGRPGAGPGAGLRRGRPDRRRRRRRRRGEDGDPRPARLRHAGQPRRRHLRGDHRDPARRHRLREGARPVAEAARRRRAARRRDQRPRLSLLPLRRPSAGADRGPVQRGHGRGAGDHRDHDVGARRRRAETASAVLGDVVSILAGEAPVDQPGTNLEIVTRRQLVLLPPPRGRRPPGRARPDRRRPRRATRSRSAASSSAGSATTPAW